MDGLNLTKMASSAPAGDGADGVKTYNKSSFFDEISCDVLDRAQGEDQAGGVRKHEESMRAEALAFRGLPPTIGVTVWYQ